MRLKLATGILILLTASGAHAAPLRVSASLGFGSSGSSNEVTESEGPLVQLYSFEYITNTKNVLGVEHMRSFAMSGMATSIAFTGVTYRYYLSNVPGPYNDLQAMPVDTFQVRDLAYFVGAGFGIGQSSFPPDLKGKEASAAGLYLNPKAGMELALSNKWGFRSELNIAMTVMGTGSLSSFSLSGGVYYMF